LTRYVDEDEAEEARCISQGRMEGEASGGKEARVNLSPKELKKLKDQFFAGANGSKSRRQAERAFALLDNWVLQKQSIITASGKITSDLSALGNRVDQKALIIGSFLIHCSTALNRSTLQPIVRGLKDHYLARMEQANHDVLDCPSIKKLIKDAKEKSTSARDASALAHSRLKQAVPHEVLEDDFALLAVFVKNGIAACPAGDIFNVIVAAASLFGFLFAARISEFGASGEEDEEGEGAHKHTLKCKEVLFKVEGVDVLVPAGKLPAGTTTKSVSRASFLSRTSKSRKHTVASFIERKTLAPGEEVGRYDQRSADGKLSHAPFGPFENNLFLDAIISISLLAGVEGECYFFSRQYAGGLKELKAKHINEHVKAGARRWGLSGDHFSSHSYKKAHVQTLQKNGFSEEEQQASAGHKAAHSTSYYRAKLVSTSSSIIFAAGAARTVAETKDEQMHIDAGVAIRKNDERKRRRVEAELAQDKFY